MICAWKFQNYSKLFKNLLCVVYMYTWTGECNQTVEVVKVIFHSIEIEHTKLISNKKYYCLWLKVYKK